MTSRALTILWKTLYWVVVSRACITRSRHLEKSFPSFALCEALLTSVEEAANSFLPEKIPNLSNWELSNILKVFLMFEN